MIVKVSASGPRRSAATRRLAGATAVIGALCCAACGTGEKSAGDNGAAPGKAAQETRDRAPDPASAEDAWALKYTGGKATRAAGAPLVIGWVNQEGATPAFPEATVGADIAVAYANERLGGAGGRPIQLKKCVVQSEEDGQLCGTQLVNDDEVSIILTGLLLVGNKSFYGAVAGKKPIVIGNPVTTDDFFVGATAPNAYSFSSGVPAVLRGMAIFALKHMGAPPKTAAIVANDNAAAKVSAEQMMKPLLDKAGVKTSIVYVSDAGQIPEYTQAVKAAGVDKADVFFPLVNPPGCVATYDALASLNLKPRVVTTLVCASREMSKHLKSLGASGEFPDGWYFSGDGYTHFIPDEESGVNTYLRVIKRNDPNLDYTGFAITGFSNVLTVTKLVNQIGADKISTQSFTEAIRGFSGPAMLHAGPVRCGENPMGASLCCSHMGIERYKDGSWESVADGINGKSIDGWSTP